MSPTDPNLEAEARELLRAEYEKIKDVRSFTRMIDEYEEAAIRAIVAALNRPAYIEPGEGEVEEAVAVLTDWLDHTPRYMGDAPKAQHYQRNVRALKTALRALTPHNAGVEGLRSALAELVEIERRDNLGDPTMTATDDWREQAWNSARAALASTPPSKTYEEGVRDVVAILDRIIGIGEASPFWDDNHVQMFRDAKDQALALLPHQGAPGM